MELNIVQRINQFWNWTRIDWFSLLISFTPLLICLFWLIRLILFRKYPNKRRQLVIALIISSILFFLINEVTFKHALIDDLWFRQRPYMAHPELISPIWKQLSDNSFPSSHMASTLLFMTLIIRECPILRPFALIFSLLMAFSRMHNWMHYPSDVIAWAILGVLYGLWWIRTSKKLIKSK